MHTGKGKQGIDPLFPMGRQPSPGQQGPITRDDDLGRQVLSLQISPHLFPLLFILSIISYSLEYFFGHLGSHPPPSSLPVWQ